MQLFKIIFVLFLSSFRDKYNTFLSEAMHEFNWKYYCIKDFVCSQISIKKTLYFIFIFLFQFILLSPGWNKIYRYFKILTKMQLNSVCLINFYKSFSHLSLLYMCVWNSAKFKRWQNYSKTYTFYQWIRYYNWCVKALTGAF